MSNDTKDVKQYLAQYLLEKVKQKDLNPKIAAKFIKEINMVSSNFNDKNDEYFAIIGVSCMFPDALGKEEFWENISMSRNSIKELPLSRRENFGLSTDLPIDTEKGGYLDNIDIFDYEYFNISPKDAIEMDPYHRLMLKVFIEVFEDAGYYNDSLRGKKIGVFVGNDHTHRLMKSYISYIKDKDFSTLVGSWTGLLASRLSYYLNLTGPAIVIDTACSSSLVAIDIAIKSILSGDCETALIGGVNLFLDPSAIDLQVNSKDAIVRTFDNQAEGTAWGEGVAGIFIKPLSKALADRDNIQGVIRGIAINNDGRSHGITAPNAKAQTEVICKAWEKANISPETISYIEAHGTGTSIGDPIEVKGIIDAFAKFSTKRQFCSIGSVKTNIGHSVGAAGLASLIKVILSMREKALPPSINFNVPNMLIDFCNSPVYVQDGLSAWLSADSPRRAGISSFSFSGTNAHLILEEPPEDERAIRDKTWEIFTISGISLEQLQESVSQYIDYLTHDMRFRLDDICYTTCTGRRHCDFRAAIICEDIPGLLLGLKFLLLAIDNSDADINLQSEKSSNDADFELALSKNINCTKLYNHYNHTLDIPEKIQMFQLAHLYVDGKDVDFKAIFRDKNVKKCSLPAMPFRKYRLWKMEMINETDVNFQKNKNMIQNSREMLPIEEIYDSDIRLLEGSGDKLERLTAWVWSEVLGYPQICKEDNFYDAGGDSINGYKIIHSLNELLNIDITISLLLSSPKFDDFVKKLKIYIENNKETDDNDISNQNREAENKHGEDKIVYLPLSPPQKRMFLTSVMSESSLAYNITVILKLNNNLTFTKVEQILKILIKRHESFRTSFYIENDKVLQMINAQVVFNLDYKKIQLDDNATNKRIDRELKDYRKPFDLSNAPLIRALYLEILNEYNYLVLDMHHIIMDGTSMGIFLSEFKSLSEGYDLKPLSNNYRDSVAYLMKLLSSEKILKQREWWLNQYQENIPIIHLPIDIPRSLTRNFEGSRVFHTIPMPLYQKVLALTKKSSATIFMSLLGALYTLLAKICSEQEIVIGTASTGHTHQSIHGVIGMFVNTIPLKIITGKTDSFYNLLEYLKIYIIKAFDYQDYPYEELINELDIKRDTGRNPLFDVFFSFQNMDIGMDDTEEDDITFYPSGSKFDLTVVATLRLEGLRIEWEYSENLFFRETIERMAYQFEILLQAIVNNPEEKLCNLKIIDKDEEALLLNRWNHIDTDMLDNKGVVSIFEEIVEKYGEKTALILDDMRMSYKELNNRSNQITHCMINMGVTPGSVIGLVLDRNFDMIASILAVLKAGCIYLPLDLNTPAVRLESMLLDSEAKLLIINSRLYDVHFDNILRLDLDCLNDTLPKDNINIKTNGEYPAYVMYSSGSTGMPKGIIIRQKGVVRLVKNAGYITILPSDVILQLSNYSFDGSVFDIFGALLNGASLVLVHKPQVIDLNIIGEVIKKNNISVFFITTMLFNALVDTSLECLRNIRVVLFGGEAVSTAHVNRAFDYLGSGRICHVYGPTETTVYATSYLLHHRIESGVIPIGKAIGNTTVYVMDDEMRLQPIGIPGELYIGGSGVADKYLNQEQLTKEKFVKNPYNKNEKLYKTGDIVVWGKDGFLRFIGRRDNQIKLRGFRIELSEIENCANNHPHISESYAGIYEDANGGKNLSIWIVLKNNEYFAQNEFREFLALTLPQYMIPVFVTVVDRIPLNKNGKVDKGQLPDPMADCEIATNEPINETEQILLNIWNQALGVKGIGTDDNFFTIGGDSIKAIQVISKIRSAGFQINVDKIFKYQTISTLAKNLKKGQSKKIIQTEVIGECRPSAIQSWFMHSTNMSNQFNHGMRIRINDQYDKSRIMNAFDKILKHHDLLRLVINPDKSMKIRDFHTGDMYFIEELDSTISEDKLKEKLILIQKSINLHEGPLVVAATKQGKVGYEIILIIHHLVVDVVSWGIVLDDLLTLILTPEQSLPDKTLPFSYWTANLDQWTEGVGAKVELDYWREIANIAKKIMPIFKLHNILQHETTCMRLKIDAEIGRILCNEITSVYHIETIHLVLAILARSFSQWINISDILINLEGHGRERFDHDLDISRTVGWFTSTYPVIVNGLGDWNQAIKKTRDTIKKVPNKGFGFGVLKSLTKDLSQEDKDMLESIKPEINFNYLGVENNDIGGDVPDITRISSEFLIDPNFKSEWALDIVGYQVGYEICFEIYCHNQLIKIYDFNDLEKLINKNALEITEHYTIKSNELEDLDSNVSLLHHDELQQIFDELGIV